MIDIGSSTGHKIGILIILTTLTIGSTAALSWNSPSADSDIGNPATINFSDADSDSSDSYDIYYQQSGDSSWSSATPNSVSDSGEIITFDWDTTNLEGDYTLNITDSSNSSNFITRDFTVDNTEPTVDSFSPSDEGYTSEESPSVSYSTSDASGIESEYIRVEDSDNNLENDANSTSVDVSDLSNGETYTVEYEVKDNVGNWNNDSWTFTVDTSYDGDSDPSFSVEDESGGVVLFDEDKDLTVDFGDTDSESDVTVTCYVEDEDVGSFDVTSDDPDEGDTTCTIDEDDDADYYDSSAEIYLEMEDEAGNTEESDSETVSFDVNDPFVSGLEISSNADLYNADFDVEFSAGDSASDVEEVEYYFDSSTDEGDGTDFGYSSDQDTYTIDTSSLSDGDHTLYVRARDEADRWSSAESIDFSFDPDATPEISLSTPDSLSITAGESGSFDYTVENTGELHISSIKVNASSGDMFSDSKSISDLEPEDSITSSFDVGTEESSIGEHTIKVSTDNPEKTNEFSLIVEANSDQRDQISSDLDKYQSELQRLESNVTNLKTKVSEENKQRLESNFSEFKNKVEDAQAAIDEGDYYKAESVFEDIQQEYADASTSYTVVKTEYEKNQFWMMIFFGLGGLVVLGVGIIGGLSYTDEFDFDIRDYLEDLQETGFDTGSLQGFTDKIKRMLQGKDTSDAEDFEWDGFNS